MRTGIPRYAAGTKKAPRGELFVRRDWLVTPFHIVSTTGFIGVRQQPFSIQLENSLNHFREYSKMVRAVCAVVLSHGTLHDRAEFRDMVLPGEQKKSTRKGAFFEAERSGAASCG